MLINTLNFFNLTPFPRTKQHPSSMKRTQETIFHLQKHKKNANPNSLHLSIRKTRNQRLKKMRNSFSISKNMGKHENVTSQKSKLC